MQYKIESFIFHHPIKLFFLLLCIVWSIGLKSANAVDYDSHTLNGKATWYGTTAHGKQTACGEIFNRYNLTAAHKTLPFGIVARVHNLNNGKSILVRITDRGPFGKGKVIDLSRRAGELAGIINAGIAPVSIEVVSDRQGSPLKAGNSFYLHLGTAGTAQEAHSLSGSLAKKTGLDIRALNAPDEGSRGFFLCSGPYETFKEAEKIFLNVEKKVPTKGIIEGPTEGGKLSEYKPE